MSISTPRFNLPYVAAAQAQKHVTHNEALHALDRIIHLRVAGIRSAPVSSVFGPVDYIVQAPASDGPWADKEGHIAHYDGDLSGSGEAQFLSPVEGWLCWDSERGTLLCYSDAKWEYVVPETFNRLGIGADADDNNRFTVKSPASLFDNAGDDHRVVVNKSDAQNTASIILQSAYTGHTEIGLTGSNDLTFKVSPDGQNWTTALTISASDGTLNVSGALKRNGASVLDADNTPGILNLKGDIGTGSDLNDYFTTGIWHQPSNSGADGGLNYPGDQAGLLTVIASGSMVYQTYRFFSAAGRGLANASFSRGRYGSNWSQWERQFTV